ncbi:MAG: hypothetical protein WBP45_14005 [Daejeonella sp.]
MITAERIFENYFDDEEVTPPRLYNFTGDVLGRLKAANTTNEYDDLVQEITSVRDAFGLEIGQVKSSLSVQKGSTLTVDEFMKGFKTYMSDNEGVIAKAVGGFKGPAFLAFYPQGVNEYTKASKTNMPALLKQVYDAAEMHKAALGTALTTELKAFESDYKLVREAQQQQKGAVGDNRVGRTANRKALELVLLKAIHYIAYLYPGETEKCLSFFDFSLLLPAGRKAKPEGEI